MKQEPRGELHQPRGQAHAFGGVGQRRVARKHLGLAATGTVEISRRLLDQGHALAEQEGERLRAGQLGAKGHRVSFIKRLVRHGYASTLSPACPARHRSVKAGRRMSLPCRKAWAALRWPESAQKKSRHCRRLKVRTGRRQTEWTGATRCQEVGRPQ